MIVSKRKLNENGDMTAWEIINAALEDDHKLVAELLQQGVDINSQFQGYTPLHIACMHGNYDLADVLLRHHKTVRAIDFSIKTIRGKVAWQLASSNGFQGLANMVLDTEHPHLATNSEILASTPAKFRPPHYGRPKPGI